MSDAEKVIPKKELFTLVNQSNQTKKKTSSLSGELGEKVKYAVENKHLHRGAFGIICKMDRMDDLKRADMRRALMLYLDMMDERWGDDTDMVDEAEAAAAAQEQADADQIASNVRMLKRGIKQKEPEPEAGLPGSPAELEAAGLPN